MKKILILLLFVSSVHAKIKVAITVDDLPTHAELPVGVTREQVATKMLTALKKHKVVEAYAFINAGKVDENQQSFEVLKLWQAAGYSFGNHTYRHEDLNQVKLDNFFAAITKNEPMLKKLSSRENWRYFRYPFLREGDTLKKRNAVRDFLKKRKYQIAQVTIDFEDWSWNNPYARCKKKNESQALLWLKNTYLQNAIDQLERAEKLSQALFNRSIPHILLLHIGAFDAEMTDALLSAYKARGVDFISLEEAAKDKVYDFDPAIVDKRGSEFTYQVLRSRHLTLQDIGMAAYTAYPEDELGKICQ